MRKGRNRRSAKGSNGSYWISYSDMMAGMLFTFALILFAAIYQLIDLQQKKTIELETKEAQLSTQQSLLIDQEAELKDKEELLATIVGCLISPVSALVSVLEQIAEKKEAA